MNYKKMRETIREEMNEANRLDVIIFIESIEKMEIKRIIEKLSKETSPKTILEFAEKLEG